MYECVCVRFYNASSDEIYPELIGECHDGEASVSVYVQDPTLADGGAVSIPEQCAPMNSYPPEERRVAYHFRLPCDRPCPDDVTDAPTVSTPDTPSQPAPSPSAVCDEDSLVAFEDFESGNADSWEHGTVSVEPRLSSFLGRLGAESDNVRKTFTVDPTSTHVTVEFLLYEIDLWKRCDKFTVIVGNKRLDLKQFYAEDSNENPNNVEEGKKGGIMWSRFSVTPAMEFVFNSQFKDQIHKVEMIIPPNYFNSGSLDFAVRVTMNDGIDSASAGIDNLRITAHGVCPGSQSSGPDRLLDVDGGKSFPTKSVATVHGGIKHIAREETKTDSASDPQLDGDDDGPYCTSRDFPCGGNGNVFICHYNPHLGYQTFCVPEEESDIVKFYANSYCGPCVGGFGGKWH